MRLFVTSVNTTTTRSLMVDVNHVASTVGQTHLLIGSCVAMQMVIVSLVVKMDILAYDVTWSVTETVWRTRPMICRYVIG